MLSPMVEVVSSCIAVVLCCGPFFIPRAEKARLDKLEKARIERMSNQASHKTVLDPYFPSKTNCRISFVFGVPLMSRIRAEIKRRDEPHAFH